VEPVRGIVTEFDDPRGIGTVTTDAGRSLLFHCTALSDGTRTIEVGVAVTVTVEPGLPGTWEAVRVTPA